MKIDELIQDENNANKGTDEGAQMIRDSIARYGVGRSILIDKHNRIIGGNKTTEAAAAVGVGDVVVVETDGTKLVAVKRTDLDIDEADARMLAYADNRAGELSLNWDAEQILADLDAGLDLGDLFDDEFVNDVLEAQAGDIEPVDAEPQISKADELRGEWGVELGQTWKLGRHTVVCGDCTKLTFGKSFDMMFTDPPYGVDYDGGHFHSGDVNIKRPREKLKSDNSTDIYNSFLKKILPIVDGACYMFFAGTKAGDVYTAVNESKGEVHALIVWHKTNATYAALNAHYKQRHEPLLYFKRKGKTLMWCGDTTESTIWELPNDGKNNFHPTQKPISLAEKAIKNHTAKEIIDPFLGSGSTLIACENTNRTCYGVEISPAYVAVVLQRFYDATGIMPELVKNEST